MHNCAKNPIEQVCDRWMTLKVTQGHENCGYSIYHFLLVVCSDNVSILHRRCLNYSEVEFSVVHSAGRHVASMNISCRLSPGPYLLSYNGFCSPFIHFPYLPVVSNTENNPCIQTVIRIATEIKTFVHWLIANSAWKFHANPCGSFYAKLLTDKQTNNDENISSLA